MDSLKVRRETLVPSFNVLAALPASSQGGLPPPFMSIRHMLKSFIMPVITGLMLIVSG
jgi:hypothetical protein